MAVIQEGDEVEVVDVREGDVVDVGVDILIMYVNAALRKGRGGCRWCRGWYK